MLWPWFVVLGVLAMTQRNRKGGGTPAEMMALIRQTAAELGVPAPIALAFADVESRFNPQAEGDLDWPTKKSEKYRDLVLNRLASNPYAREPSLWHSYGLYQLHAAHFVRGNEDPRILLDPQVNAERGIRFIRSLLDTVGGDPLEARYRYVGCGRKGANCAAAVRERVRARILQALSDYGGVA